MAENTHEIKEQFFPNELTHLTVKTGFELIPIDNYPQKLTHLNTGYGLTRGIDKFPKTLIHLKLGRLCQDFLDNLQ